jgi:GNAT superfamily N-acetyltransferase
MTSNELIVKYVPEMRSDVEIFRAKTFDEGNNSLDIRKFDPDTLQGQIWLAYVDGKVVSLSAAEVSHYTNETNVVRKCRYHILKEYRHGRYGFKFLQEMIPWCKQYNYKLLYWTHDVNNVSLNALYQRKRTYAFSKDTAWFHQWPFTELQFEEDMLFRTWDIIQFVYSIYIDPDFVWRPAENKHIVYCNHNGNVELIPDLPKVPT